MLAHSTCDYCGLTDDHPKIHYGLNTYHHNHAPANVRAEVIATAPLAKKIFDACDSGKRGQKLRDYIFELHANGESN